MEPPESRLQFTLGQRRLTLEAEHEPISAIPGSEIKVYDSALVFYLCLVSVHSGRLRTASMNKAQSRILNCAGGPEKERRRNPTPSLYLQLTQLRTDASLLLLNELING